MNQINRNVIAKDIEALKNNANRSLDGFMLTSEELSVITLKLLVSMGISANSIKPIIVGLDKNHKIRICAEIARNALTKSSNPVKKPNDEFTAFFANNNSENPKTINQDFIKEMKYKFFTKLVYDIKDKYFKIVFDPMILISYAFNIQYDNPMYVIKPIDAISKNKDRRKLLARNALTDCGILVLYSKNGAGYNENQVKKLEDK